MDEKKSIKEDRIRKITTLYYSRKDIQQEIFDFCKNREVVPRYFEGFGKRPDSFQYPADIFGLVKKGATSFNCSQEIWQNPLKISTDLSEKQLSEIRTGWDLLLDIDSKYLDYGKILTEIIIKILNFYGVKNIGVKFSGSKGFHIIVPWKSFPKEINNKKTSEMFPELPRIITKFIMNAAKKELIEKVSVLGKENFSIYVKDFEAPKDVFPDLVLISSRHLFRTPYSLHEKTALASIVIEPSQVMKFHPRDADPLKIKIKKFMPDSQEGEATELVREAIDWDKNKNPKKINEKKEFENKPLDFSGNSDEIFPPTIKKILEGMVDGKKRALFVLINFFRSINLEKQEIEKRIYDWNEKNKEHLNESYIKNQLSWSFKNKLVLPPNYDGEYYSGIGIDPTKEELKSKNPVNYVKIKIFNKNFKKNKK